MKKLLIATTMIAGLSVCTANAFAADGTINFKGSITDSACTVSNSVANPLTVTLGTVSSKGFTAAGVTAAPTKFDIGLTDCPDSMKSASVKFDGDSANSDDSVLKLTPGDEVATGVGIQIVDNAGKVVQLATSSTATPLTKGINNLQFIARYISIADKVTGGKADSTAQFSIIYN